MILYEKEKMRNHEVPASTRDKALFYCTKPSGVRSGPSQLHSIPDFSEAPWKAPWGHGHKSTEPRVSCRNLRKTSRVLLHASWGPIPLPWLEKNDALPLTTRMKIWLPRHHMRVSLSSPSYLVRNPTLAPQLGKTHETPPSSRDWVAQGTLLHVMWQPGGEGSLQENGYMYMYDWVPSLLTWNYHNIVNRLDSSMK